MEEEVVWTKKHWRETVGRSAKADVSRPLVVIWLILPVVICLSQGLSHACVSISIIRRNCEWLITSVIVYLIIESYMDNRDKLQLIHAIRSGPRIVVISIKLLPQGM